jgi:hypothetical protein
LLVGLLKLRSLDYVLQGFWDYGNVGSVACGG